MLKLSCKIEIEGAQHWVFDKVSKIVINRSTETLTDTCTVTLPKKIKWQGADAIPLKRGDKVKVQLGYNDELSLAFVGYISTIGAKTPIEIRCEDEMWQLKTKEATKKAYMNVNIETLLTDQSLDFPVEVLGVQKLGAYRQDKDTVAGLLDNLKEQGVRSFFKYNDNGSATLVCGVIFPEHDKCKATFCNYKNIIDDSDLQVQNAKDMKLRIKAVSIDDDNKRTTVEVGDADGEVRTLYKYALSATELKEWAEAQLTRLKRDGLVGSFETFGHILIDKLDTIAIVLDDVKMGEYQIESNEISYSESGFRQKIKLA